MIVLGTLTHFNVWCSLAYRCNLCLCEKFRIRCEICHTIFWSNFAQSYACFSIRERTSIYSSNCIRMFLKMHLGILPQNSKKYIFFNYKIGIPLRSLWGPHSEERVVKMFNLVLKHSNHSKILVSFSISSGHKFWASWVSFREYSSLF